MFRLFSTFAPLASALMSAGMWPSPPPPLVTKGMMILLVKSFSARKVATGGAMVLNQLGVPSRMTSQAPRSVCYARGGR